ncbi:DUF2249 domain-containing protein [Tissierella sp.]|uniref:DUF2249 domain-containing protein n=1 Tax=Tissierella sp. TaxID=41274 RepID=UPI002862839F|nr:DUF2249 domain-containing protein [Tissierella sp.]MDR7856531.1 DUF2249 domain-containing protein [Tissierella sp.]
MSILQIDTSGYTASDVNSVVLRTFSSLPVGEKMMLINDSDLSHAFKQLEENQYGKFEWEYIEEGPDVWKVSLAKKYLNYI